MTEPQIFNIQFLSNYNNEPNTDAFYKSMSTRGFKLDLIEKKMLEQCEGKIQRYGSKRKDIFVSNNIDCHDFFYLLADKYNMNYISYKLVLNSLDNQTLKNLYRFVWVEWQEALNTICNYLNENSNIDDNDEIIELVNSFIGHDFKYNPEQIDNIYNTDKLRRKVLDGFNKFSKKKQLYANFILQQIQNYFLV